jgi:hypothetical protein
MKLPVMKLALLKSSFIIIVILITINGISQSLFRYQDGVYADYKLDVYSLFIKDGGLDKAYTGKPLPYTAVLRFGKKNLELKIIDNANDQPVFASMEKLVERSFQFKKVSSEEEDYVLDMSSESLQDKVTVSFKKVNANLVMVSLMVRTKLKTAEQVSTYILANTVVRMQ